jgi:hypothetical protein
MPSEAYLKAMAEPRVQNTEAPQTVTTTRPQSTGRRAARVKGYFDDAGATFAGQLGNDLLGNWLDEAASYSEYYIQRPLGISDTPAYLKTREEIRQYYEESLVVGNEKNPVAGWGGTISSFFVPVGWAAKTTKAISAGRLAVAGGFYGAVAGAGASQPGERLDGAIFGGGAGLAGGFVLGAAVVPLAKYGANKLGFFMERGRAPSLEFDPPIRRPRQQPTATAGLADEARPAYIDDAIDELEEGALLRGSELRGDPALAAKTVAARVASMSATDAQTMLTRIETAKADGTVFSDPHFRSILNLDLEGKELTREEMMQAASILEDSVEELAAKAGVGVSKSVDEMQSAAEKELRKGLTTAELKDMYEGGKEDFVKLSIAQTASYSSLARIVALKDELLPKVLEGVEGARQEMTERLSTLVDNYIYAMGIKSNAGRALGILSHKQAPAELQIVEKMADLTPAEIAARVKASLDAIGDKELKQLLGRLKNTNEAAKVLNILTDGAEAKAFTTWQRTVGTVSMFLRSTPLTFATATFNVIGVVGQDLLRNHVTKIMAAKALTKNGNLTEAMALRFEEKAARAVMGKAHLAGISAAMKRIQWDLWDSVEQVASVGWGKGKVAALAQKKQSTILADGFVPGIEREASKKPRLNIEDTGAFNAANEARRLEGGAFSNLIYHAEKARAVAANTFDALGSASAKLFTGAIDDYGREFVRLKETYAQATRFAVREAYENGVPADEFPTHVAARAKEIAELPGAQIMKLVEDALLDAPDGKLVGEAAFFRDLNKLLDENADTILAMDGPQGAGMKAAAKLLTKADPLGIVMPYVNTPIRLFELGLIDQGPLGFMSKRIQDEINKGGIEGALAKARVEAGVMVGGMGVLLGMLGVVTATNGAFGNSAGLDAGPANRLNLPGGLFVEIGRLDPHSLTLGLGAMFGQAFRDGYDATRHEDWEAGLQAALATGIAGTWDVILDKSYLKGLKDFVDALSQTEGGAFGKFEKLAQNAVARMIPASGVSRQINETFRTSAIESIGWYDNFLRHIPGAGWGMAAQIDPLGDEVKSRTMGINMGNSELTEGEAITPVKAKLRDLGIKINTLRKTDLEGFDLTSEELSEVRRIRGKEAQNEDGLTMTQALGELFEDPWFNNLGTKEAKRTAVVDVMKEFNAPAWEIMQERRPDFAGKKVYYKSLQDYIKVDGLKQREAEKAAAQDVFDEGLPLPQ